jgi:hypothetical protein
LTFWDTGNWNMRLDNLTVEQLEKRIIKLSEKRYAVREVLKDITSEKGKKTMRVQMENYKTLIAELKEELKERSE